MGRQIKMNLNPDTLSILKSWKNDIEQIHHIDEFIIIEDKDWELIEYFATKKFSTKNSQEFLEDIENFQTKDFYIKDPFRLILDLKNSCAFRRRGEKSRQIQQDIDKAFHMNIFYSFETDVFNPFLWRSKTYRDMNWSIRNHEEHCAGLEAWKFSIAEEILDLDKNKEKN